MATYTSTQWNWEAYTPRAGEMAIAYGICDTGATVIANADVFQFCQIPQRAVVCGGMLQGEGLDTNATPAIDFELGTSDDQNKYGTYANLDDAAIAGHKPAGWLFHVGGVLTEGASAQGLADELSASEGIIGTVTGAPGTAAAGILAAFINYTTPKT